MARIVQDSDEELDDDLERDLPPPKQPDAIGKPPSNNAATHGIGSAESISKPTEEVHNARLEFQPQPASHGEPQSSVPLPEHPNKKRRITAEMSPLRSPVASSAKKKSPVTYGRKLKSILSSSAASDTQTENQSGRCAAEPNLLPAHEDIWNLAGTMRDEYALHEPAMFPEPSSTVPNATMTQQRVMEAVRAPVMLGEELEMGRPLYQPPPEPSVPWSDLMKFTPGEAVEQTESSDREPPALNVFCASPLRKTQKDLVSSPPQPDQGGSFALSTSPLKNEVSHARTFNTEQNLLPSHTSPAADSDMLPTAPQVSQRSGKEEARKPSRQSKTQVPIQGSDDDFNAIGLPVDQYKPRPSRSRSLKIDSEDAIDYSVRPEKIRRRRTAAAVEAATTVTTPEKVRQICDMGFTPSTTTGALKRNNGDVMHTIDWLVNNNIDHDELAPQSPRRSKSTSKKAMQVSTMDSDAIQDIMRNLNEYRRDEVEVEPTATDSIATRHETTNNATKSPNEGLRPVMPLTTSPTKVQVVIPKKSPRPVTTQPADAAITSGKKAKRRKTTLDEPEGEPIMLASVVPEKVNEKKKRGRPKKAATTVAPSEPPEPIVEALEQDANAIVQKPEPNPASETAQPRSETALKETTLLVQTESESPANSNLLSEPSPAAASATPEQSTKATTASPIMKGKVPYRVGLSKRARIAPLLRTLKK